MSVVYLFIDISSSIYLRLIKKAGLMDYIHSKSDRNLLWRDNLIHKTKRTVSVTLNFVHRRILD